jgi:hypothetical protein
MKRSVIISVQVGHSGGLSHVALISVRKRGESRKRIPNILELYKLAVYRICTASLERMLNIVNLEQTFGIILN